MAIEVFNRYEKKYRLTSEQAELMQRILDDRMSLDSYNKRDYTYRIKNIYYDTESDELIRHSLSKPKFKEKLRLRAYGDADENCPVYIEIKKKVNKLVNKRRSAMYIDEALEFLKSGVLPESRAHHNRQVLNEVAYMLGRYELHPAVYIAYDRRAYFSKDESDLRVSFDRSITTRRTALDFGSGDGGDQLLESGEWIMEVKTAYSMPMWLTRLLAEYEAYPSGFSKYGAEFKIAQKARVGNFSQEFAARFAPIAAVRGINPVHAL